MWGEPGQRAGMHVHIDISTHSPRVGRTVGERLHTDCDYNFNSLAPCGANLWDVFIFILIFEFQLTRPVWGEPADAMARVAKRCISTHSPRVGRTALIIRRRRRCHFNSLAPCGANRAAGGHACAYRQFQLTRPVWGEPLINIFGTIATTISTHSPRVGRTLTRAGLYKRKSISTHSPRVGRTRVSNFISAWNTNFNSLAPCGANLAATSVRRPDCSFQLTRPVWGEPERKSN